ncbi:MAG: GNAT family N-acetyltransferase [Prochloraceae cyanobacterium]|nr:GNAT family N-acetyltransferase [Prochloraceae cyanobacterium]
MLPQGYQLRRGSGKDRANLVKFMCLTYQELFPDQQGFSHLAKTVEQYFSADTPLLWVEPVLEKQTPIAVCWIGNAIDQVKGDRYAHIFLLYVAKEHRRQGIGTALMNYAQNWASSRGDRQISLQVFTNNQPAINFYQSLGYKTQSLFMLKPL